jgi:hypothetical protein
VNGSTGDAAAEVVLLGETMAVLTAEQVAPLRHTRSMSLSVAGSEATVAIGLARLGHGAVWIGRVGQTSLACSSEAHCVAKASTLSWSSILTPRPG